MSKNEVPDISNENLKDKPKCGIVMPISSIDNCPADHWQDVLKILQEAITNAGYHANLVSSSDDSGVIQKRIVQNLYDNEIVVCDVSCKNPNVMFELGMRLAFDKPTIIIIDDKTGYSFDTAIIEHLTYPRDLRYGKINEFKIKLKEKIIATIKKSTDDPNYTTFLKQFGEFKVAKIEEKTGSKEDIILSILQDLTDDIDLVKKRTTRLDRKYINHEMKIDKMRMLIREGIEEYCKIFNINESSVRTSENILKDLIAFLESNPEIREVCSNRETLHKNVLNSIAPF